RGFEVVLVLGPCATWAVDPAWEVPEDERPNSIPQSRDDWRRYVREAVEHYRGRVTHWQVRVHPSAPNFRGARAEYRALFLAAAEEVSTADPQAKLILPEAGYLDLAAVDQLLQSEIRDRVGVVGVFAPTDLVRASLQWAVLSQEILGQSGETKKQPVWLLGGGEELRTADEWRAHYLLSWVFGAERCYLPEAALDPTWYAELQDLDYLGYARPSDRVWAFVFARGNETIALAWSAEESPVPEGLLSEEAPPEQDAAQAPTTIGLQPVVIRHVDWGPTLRPGSPTRTEVLSARPGLDLSGVPVVFVDYSLPMAPEFGLYHRRLRDFQGGAVEELDRTGRRCVRTKMTYRRGEEQLDNPWIYFDVDDAWLYFDRGQSRLVVTVECEGSYLGEQKLGLNLLYDSTRGYRFTPWQWVDPGYEWHAYRFELDDVNMANRDGYDFRINAKGSKQDLYVFSVTVEKLPVQETISAEGRDEPEEAPPAGGGDEGG
ncbi:MAG: hypothetical protein JXA57_17615, partial [Armatimonadetes bacterium]|nr:hypothetical protein [Armatimonadota bacterium]